MILKNLLIIATSVLSFYIIYKAINFLHIVSSEKKINSEVSQNVFTIFFIKLTMIVAIFWWISLLLINIIYIEHELHSQHFFIKSTGFLIICILSVLSLIMYRNHVYHKYLSDHIVRTFIFEYVLSIVCGILFSSVIAYTIEIYVLM